MRQIVLDTETTGLEYKLGHRIVEIAAVELCNRQLTGNHFHHYLNPERESDEGALQVHGLTRTFLEDKPKFREISRDFLDFVYDAELIIHNAPFDVGFLNHELGLVKLLTLDTYCLQITDTLKLAKDLHPGKRNNLDALCDRYKIDNSKRTLHGALLDAELLAEVYLAMTRGQESLLMDLDVINPVDGSTVCDIKDLTLRVLPATAAELEQHTRQLECISKESNNQCIWKNLND
ncbi:DNA polymerase III subunit epsilon [Nitrosomonas aestuarii]|uniref:DNA polymerase III subunit epsilon n=1 Tax=Nitrosomonas aestuarii TaxID=52441 RepID=UPI000D310E32|nr:DNA polymerase III subunit epsilon [Nitrosomonas aestuarii]PTN11550.1 DNA polymerase-3 subunit epsilon [Nitrosomonas aestuarii]